MQKSQSIMSHNKKNHKMQKMQKAQPLVWCKFETL